MPGPGDKAKEKWEEFSSDVIFEIKKRHPEGLGFDVNDKGWRYLSCRVYQFIEDYKKNFPKDKGFQHLLVAMRGVRPSDATRSRWKRARVNMTLNPYHGVFVGLRDPSITEREDIEGLDKDEALACLKRSLTWRAAKALVDAAEEQVPAQHLLGFIKQWGGIRALGEGRYQRARAARLKQETPPGADFKVGG